MEGGHLAEPLPRWLSECHETYLIGQACPWWQPPEDEQSDFKLRVMARIHSIHENVRLKQQAQIAGAGDG